MRLVSQLNKKIALFVALACLVLGGSLSAFAVPTNQVARVETGQSVTAACCVPIGPTVRINEPATVTPVIVTFNTDFVVNGTSQFGLSVNGGPCAFFGATVVPSLSFGPGSNGPFMSSSFNWVVLPSDGLVQGSNTFTVCAGGATGGPPVKIDLGFRTLTVQIGK